MSTVTHGQTSAGWTVDDSTFGARLALIRVRMDWNLKEAARACGLPAASWRTWERDGAMPRRVVEVCKLISDSTGCNYLWLLTGSATGEGAIRRYQQVVIPRQMSPAQVRPMNRAETVARPPNRRNDSRRPVLVRGSSFD